MSIQTHAPGIATLATRLRSGETTAAGILESCFEQIALRGSELNAFITVLTDSARAQSHAADREIAAGRNRGPLHGIPISLKDLIDVEEVPTTAASAVRGHRPALHDARVVARLREAGAVIVGKCNMHEFAFGTTNEDSAFGPARNPIDPTRSPGGSSGGSAIAVATGMSIASIGSDTGGSIRIPAAACGVVGLKPTYGDISCEGVVPLSRSLDHVGPLTRTVGDAWILYHVLAGKALPADSQDLSRAPINLSSVRVGVPRAYFFDKLDDEVRACIDDALARLATAGVRVRDVNIAHAADTAPIYLHVCFPEVAAYHAQTIERCPADYTPPVRHRIEAARYVLAEDYVRAERGRVCLRHEVDSALDAEDALMLPTLPVPAPPLGAATVPVGDSHEPVRNIMLRLTQLFNLTGHPAISIPVGRTSAGLPIGLQIVGRRGETPALLRLAAACEQALQA